MKKSVLKILFIVGVLMVGFLHNAAHAQTKTSTQSGNYSNGSTWVGGSAPGPGDNIVIKSGHTVTLDVAGKDVHDITIEAGAIFDNGDFDLRIQKSGGNPTYKNDGTHNSGNGNLILYNAFYTRVRGTGVSSINFNVRDYGIQVLYDCQLTINGNLQHHTTVTYAIMDLIVNTEGGTLTINGNIVPNPGKAISIGNGIFDFEGTTYVGTITVNGNVDLTSFDSWWGSACGLANDGIFHISGDLILGGNFTLVQNNGGEFTIGGDLLGPGLGDWEAFFINIGYLGLGGNLFPQTQDGNFITSETSTVEYFGSASQTIFNPWDENFEEGPYNNLIIGNTNAIASIATPIGATNLTIKPGSALTVGTGGSLSVSGAFNIESDALGTGSFISPASYPVNFQRYIAGHFGNDNHGWHFLSSPVNSQAIGAFHTAGSGDDFYKWDEPTDTWINRTAAGGGLNPDFETVFNPGRGYLVANAATDTKLFTGSLNASDLAVTNLSYSTGNVHAGWHLIGNPFSSAVTWNDGNWNLNNVDAISQIWNEANASYTVIMANEIIPSGNGFMVHASAANASLTIPASSRTHSATAWYKTGDENERLVLTMIDPEGQTAQPTIIRFNHNASGSYDSNLDSYFLAGFAPLFYSISEQELYALNTLPEFSSGLSIPLGFVKNSSNNFILELTESMPGQTVYLTDHKTAETHLLSDGNYSFNAEGSDDANRFTLHFEALGFNESGADENIQAWFSNGKLNLINKEPGVIALYDLQGRLIHSNEVQQTGYYSRSMNLPSGIYVLQVQTRSNSKSVKINVQ